MDTRSLIDKAKFRKLNDNRNASTTSLCDLPEVVLLHILSFLPSKDVVRTSALSKRWEQLWISVPKLDFNDKEFSQRLRFINFVERTFLLHGLSPVKGFSLSCSIHYNKSRINAWITSAIRRNVEKLRLCLDVDKRAAVSYRLPCCVFRCETLTELHVEMSRHIRLTSSVCLMKLKALTLVRIDFGDDNSVEKLLSGPSLEKLSLDNCMWWKLKALRISAPKLLSLSIVELEFCTDFKCDCRVFIIGTSLESFYYHGECAYDYTLSSSSALVKAAISVDHPFDEKSYQFSYHGYKLLKDVANVRDLTLSYDGLQDLNESKNFLDSLPIFANLKKLELNMYRACLESRALQTILSKSSCLESLRFLSGVLVESGTDEGIRDPVPWCFPSSLREITIRNFHEDDDQLLAVRVMLRTARVLEKIVIHRSEYYLGSSTEKLMERLREIPKASRIGDSILQFIRKVIYPVCTLEMKGQYLRNVIQLLAHEASIKWFWLRKISYRIE
ncbi:F-box/LRR-repeat protein At3g59190-like [Rhodamnia argentea]|uniref:F-box/LRR-repeat protein At3g59190-like n=1 Tax=Rhodamnia argentea TaxID=178133 RepID=A0A8B8MVA2_9MYRT|nr:F-box/LRR-repeat protein At3g59190-like [Rhodamnia argentea]